MKRSLVVVWGLMFTGTAHAACVWEGSASSFFRCLMETSERVDDNAARLDGVEAAVWDLSDALLTAGDVLSTVAGEGYALLVDIAPVGLTGLFSDLEGIPEGLLDGDDDTVGRLVCTAGQVAVFDGGGWVCGEAGIDVDEFDEVLARLESLESASGGSASGVMYGHYYIENSVDLASFAGFTEVTGNLQINAGTMPDVDGLESLTTVGGSLSINSLGLENIDGLSNLTDVGGELRIEESDALVNVDGLSGLSAVGGDLYIYQNNVLENIDGLSGIESVEGHVIVWDNGSLVNVDGLMNLSSVGDGVDINANPVLTSVDLASLTDLDEVLYVRSNDSLTSVVAPNLTTIWTDLEILQNPVLSTVEFASLGSVNANLYLNSNDSMTSHSGFPLLTTVGNVLQITNNDILVDLDMPSMASVSELDIRFNDALCQSDVDAFASTLIIERGVTELYGNDDGC